MVTTNEGNECPSELLEHARLVQLSRQWNSEVLVSDMKIGGAVILLREAITSLAVQLQTERRLVLLGDVDDFLARKIHRDSESEYHVLKFLRQSLYLPIKLLVHEILDFPHFSRQYCELPGYDAMDLSHVF